jgi:hypothetical protein
MLPEGARAARELGGGASSGRPRCEDRRTKASARDLLAVVELRRRSQPEWTRAGGPPPQLYATRDNLSKTTALAPLPATAPSSPERSRGASGRDVKAIVPAPTSRLAASDHPVWPSREVGLRDKASRRVARSPVGIAELFLASTRQSPRRYPRLLLEQDRGGALPDAASAPAVPRVDARRRERRVGLNAALEAKL